VWRIEGATGKETGRVRSSCQPSLVSPGEAVVAIMAGRFCQPPADAFSPAAWQMPRLPGENSSISARMACMSSVAEITGNSRTNTQPRAPSNTSGRVAGPFAGLPARLSEPVEAVRCRHSR